MNRDQGYYLAPTGRTILQPHEKVVQQQTSLMKGSEWALNALRNFKDFIGVEEYFSTLC